MNIMMISEYPRSQADQDLMASVVARLHRMSTMLSKLREELDDIDVEAVGGDGDVVLSVNYQGQLTSLSLAQGCTTRYTPQTLTKLINTTIEQAVNAANAEVAALTSAQDEQTVDASIEARAKSDGEMWSRRVARSGRQTSQLDDSDYMNPRAAQPTGVGRRGGNGVARGYSCALVERAHQVANLVG
jgi:DNA-binding protein YbaB